MLTLTLALMLTLTACGMAFAEQEARKIETAADADEWIQMLFGEHPEELDSAWELVPEVKTALDAAGGMKAVAASLASLAILPAAGDSEKALGIALTGFAPAVRTAAEELAPHKICGYIYELSNAFNRFYHETKILTEEKEAQKESYIALLELTRRVLEQGIELLGFSAPERM